MLVLRGFKMAAMFCEQCGNPLGPDAKFCSACGAFVAGGAVSKVLPYADTQADRIPDDKPIIVLKPKFIGWVTALSVLPIQLFMTVWAGGFCGGFSTAGIKGLNALGLSGIVPVWFPFVFFASLAFFGIPGAVYFGKKRSYAKTEYRFYPTRLEYYEGWFVIQQKTIDYRHIQEVNLQKGMIQRRYGLGTLVLATPATAATGGNGTWKSGIRIVDVEDPDTLYEQVRRLVQEAQVRSR